MDIIIKVGIVLFLVAFFIINALIFVCLFVSKITENEDRRRYEEIKNSKKTPLRGINRGEKID